MQIEGFEIDFETIKHRKTSVSCSVTLEQYNLMKQLGLKPTKLLQEKLKEVLNDPTYES